MKHLALGILVPFAALPSFSCISEGAGSITGDTEDTESAGKAKLHYYLSARSVSVSSVVVLPEIPSGSVF
jgi:hypothetical protein